MDTFRVGTIIILAVCVFFLWYMRVITGWLECMQRRRFEEERERFIEEVGEEVVRAYEAVTGRRYP